MPPEDAGAPQASRLERVRTAADKFAAKTSLNGVPFIQGSNHTLHKAFWVLVFLSFIGIGIFHWVQICFTYFAFTPTTLIALDYDKLPFPSVTVCNINPLRINLLSQQSPASSLRNFLTTLVPQDRYTRPMSQRPASAASIDQQSALDPARPVVTSGGTGATPIASEVREHRKKLNLTVDYEKYIGELLNDDALLYGGGPISEELKIDEEFRKYKAMINESDLIRMGHQKNTLIGLCSFNGRKCSSANFTSFLDGTFGNCFTFNSAEVRKQSLQSRQAGAIYGLNMVLYIQDHEYLPSLDSGRGVKIAVHAFNTTPFLADVGISAPPGFETFIGMRLKNGSRLGAPYGDCDDDGDYENYYGRKYTSEGCLKTCLDRLIQRNCNCYRREYAQYYSKHSLRKLKSCDTEEKKLRCVYALRHQMEVQGLNCHCNKPCSVCKHELETSTSLWPDVGFWFPLVNFVCEVDDLGCWLLQDGGKNVVNREALLRKNFLAVKIYYRDMNFESIIEQPSYELPQFLSDIGGAIGLWLGASVITGVECIDFVMQFFCYACGRRGGSGSSDGEETNKRRKKSKIGRAEKDPELTKQLREGEGLVATMKV